jgi:hypothetical protein
VSESNGPFTNADVPARWADDAIARAEAALAAAEEARESVLSAALTVIACPPGGWPETQQALRRFSDVAGNWVDGRYRVPDVVEVARIALREGAARPAYASEWGL